MQYLSKPATSSDSFTLSSANEESSENDFLRMEQEGEAVDGDGKNFCQAPLGPSPPSVADAVALLFPDEVGVVIRTSESRSRAGGLLTRGDITDGELRDGDGRDSDFPPIPP